MKGYDHCAGARAELGVYLLGAIEPSDRAAVDQHLATCPRCREELASLAGLPALLRRVPDGQLILNPEPAVQEITAARPDVLLRRAARLRRRNGALAAAAAAVLIAGTAAVSTTEHGGSQPQALPRPVWAATIQASNPATRVWASVRYAPRRWGTDIEARIIGVAAGTRCQLWVTDPGGQRIPAGSWTVATARTALWYPASASLSAASVRSFQITTSQGKSLVTIPARATPSSTARSPSGYPTTTS